MARPVNTFEFENVLPLSILYSKVFPLGLVTLIVIEPVSPWSEHAISDLLTVKSGAGIVSTVIDVCAEQLFESTTRISYTPAVETGIIGVV